MTTEVNIKNITTDTISKMVSETLMETVRKHSASNLAFVLGPFDGLLTERTDYSDVDDLEGCVYIIKLTDIDIRYIEHIFPASYDGINMAGFYHQMHDKFPELEGTIDDALNVLSEGAWEIDEWEFPED